MTQVSIISAAYNSAAHIRPFIESILQTTGVQYDLTIVDDGSTDDTASIIRSLALPPHITCISLPVNKGASYARNFAAKQGNGTYVMYFDIDARITPTTVKKLIQPLRHDQTVGVTQAVLMNANGTIESTGHHLFWCGLPYNVAYTYPSSAPIPIFGTRVAFAIRRDLFEKIQGYDEQFVIYAEDTDISWRVWRTGHRIILLPDVQVAHLKKSSLSTKTNYRIYYEGTKNMLIMLFKNLPPILMWIVPLFIITWIIISINMLFSAKRGMIRWVIRGIVRGLVQIPIVLVWRKCNTRLYSHPVPLKIIFGNLNVRTILQKALHITQHS